MPCYNFPPLDVGFQRGASIGAFRQFLYSFLAFLTAKTLALGVDKRDRKAVWVASFIRPSSSGPDFQIYWGPSIDAPPPPPIDDPRILPRQKFVIAVNSGSGLRRAYLPLGMEGDYRFRVFPRGDRTALPSYIFRQSEDSEKSWVFFNPCAVVAVIAMMYAARAQSAVEQQVVCVLPRLLGDAVKPPGIAVLCLVGCLSAIALVLDVVLGVVMRALQVPYFVMMYLWHHCGGPCFFAKIDEHATTAKTKAAVFRLRDQVVTCLAVVVNSVVVAAGVHAALLSLFGVSAAVATAFEIFSGVLAILTLAGVCVTAYRMRVKNAKLSSESERLPGFIWEQDSQGADVPPTGDAQYGSRVGYGSHPPQGDRLASLEAFRRDQLVGACRGMAEILYLGALIPGAYLPAHFSAGYCGATAFSFVEELCHFVPHVLSSAVICGFERFCEAPVGETRTVSLY